MDDVIDVSITTFDQTLSGFAGDGNITWSDGGDWLIGGGGNLLVFRSKNAASDNNPTTELQGRIFDPSTNT